MEGVLQNNIQERRVTVVFIQYIWGKKFMPLFPDFWPKANLDIYEIHPGEY